MPGDDRFGVILHTSGGPDAEIFLDELAVKWYLNFNSDVSQIPDGRHKVPFIGVVDPSSLMTTTSIASLVASAPLGSYWYVGGEPNDPIKFVSGSKFADVFHYYFTEITRNDPTAKVMSPSLLNWWFTCFECGGYQSGRDWAEDFITAYRANHEGKNPPVAAWSIDLYPIDWRGFVAKGVGGDPSQFLPNDNWKLIRDQITGGAWPIVGLGGEMAKRFFVVPDPITYEGMRAYLDQKGYQDTPIWITEIAVHWGYDNIVATIPPRPTGNYRWDTLSAFMNEIFGWLKTNAGNFLIERWFLFTSWKNIAQSAVDAYAGIILFGSNEATAPAQAGLTGPNCLGEVYRALSLGLDTIQCDLQGNVVP